jgi:hypothetical protein
MVIGSLPKCRAMSLTNAPVNFLAKYLTMARPKRMVKDRCERIREKGGKYAASSFRFNDQSYGKQVVRKEDPKVRKP